MVGLLLIKLLLLLFVRAALAFEFVALVSKDPASNGPDRPTN
jgi:hypothetical protein